MPINLPQGTVVLKPRPTSFGAISRVVSTGTGKAMIEKFEKGRWKPVREASILDYGSIFKSSQDITFFHT